MKTVKVGILGFGTVGAGVAENLLNNCDVIASRTGVRPVLTKIADLDVTRDRGVKIPDGVLTTDGNAMLNEVDVVVELVGGTTFAGDFILKALKAGKPVVTANKALLAVRGKELFAAAEAAGVDLYYEASVAGGIPVIKALREGLVGNRINRIYGILNGTCNYILTRMEAEGAPFDAILKDAQKLGYAEANPTLDVDGFDTAHKTAILGALAYGEWFGLDPVSIEGIRGIEPMDIQTAGELGYRFKLLSAIKNENGKVQLSVAPTLVAKDSMLGAISGVFNGVMIEGDTVGTTLFYGRGAGRKATASAVVADVTDAALNLACGCPRRVAPFQPGKQFDSLLAPGEAVSRYYWHLTVRDEIGVMMQVTTVLAKYDISISSLIQRENGAVDANAVPLILLTHKAAEKSVKAAIAELEKMDIVTAPVKAFRIEDVNSNA